MRSPVVAVQLIVKVACAVLFAAIETVCGLAPLTLQLDGIGLKLTECVATLRLLNVTLPVAPTDWLLAPASTVTVYPEGGFGPLVVVLTVRLPLGGAAQVTANADRKSTRLNSSHVAISYAVFCLKKK